MQVHPADSEPKRYHLKRNKFLPLINSKFSPLITIYRYFIPIIFLLVILSSGNLSAQIPQWEKQLKSDPTNTEVLLKLGKACHDVAGENEDKEAVKKAEGYLSKLLAIEPDNAPAMVYYGSVLTMKAREAFLPWDKMKYMKKGYPLNI